MGGGIKCGDYVCVDACHSLTVSATFVLLCMSLRVLRNKCASQYTLTHPNLTSALTRPVPLAQEMLQKLGRRATSRPARPSPAHLSSMERNSSRPSAAAGARAKAMRKGAARWSRVRLRSRRSVLTSPRGPRGDSEKEREPSNKDLAFCSFPRMN